MNLDTDELKRQCGRAILMAGVTPSKKTLRTAKIIEMIWFFWQGVRAMNGGVLPPSVEIKMMCGRMDELATFDGEVK